MDSVIYTPGWSQHHRPSSRPSSGLALSQIRSLSSMTSTAQSTPPSPVSSKPRRPYKSPSASQLPTLSPTALQTAFTDSDELSTLPDPRSRSRSPASHEAQLSPRHHPDLDGEVATLSTKLIDAINYQTVLDDTLSATRHELAAARDHIRALEAQNESMRETVKGDVWIRRSALDAEKKAMQLEKKGLQAKMADEVNKRLDTEKEKRKIEQELENLTTALFEEANKMVIAAKEEAKTQHDVLQRKIDQLKAQLADSETLLKSQQEQLSGLKTVMETMASEQDDQTYGTAPPSPAFGQNEHENDHGAIPTADDSEPASLSVTSFAPCPPLSLQDLVRPVLRTDLSVYDDFINLCRLSHGRDSPTRASSGSFGAFNGLGLGLGGLTSSSHPSNASNASLTTGTQADKAASQAPHTPGSTAGAVSASISNLPLKETRFYKRALVEDIEPTLRLDLAPGLSWLARRTVLSSIAEGSLVVEPIPASATYVAIVKPQLQPCSLCGESRSEAQYLRNHRFRTSEADSAQQYPLCKYCLNRVRSTCDYLGFLRVVKDGHWRANDEDPERAAWEESVKLRDQMFWARIGGGVVPAGAAVAPSQDESEQPARASHDSKASHSSKAGHDSKTSEKKTSSLSHGSDNEAASSAFNGRDG